MSDEGKVTLGVLAVCCMIFAVILWLNTVQCESRAEMMGMAHSYAPLQGCMIEYEPGKWILLERYRAFD